MEHVSDNSCEIVQLETGRHNKKWVKVVVIFGILIFLAIYFFITLLEIQCFHLKIAHIL